jgi:hypothetical protein
MHTLKIEKNGEAIMEHTHTSIAKPGSHPPSMFLI